MSRTHLTEEDFIETREDHRQDAINGTGTASINIHLEKGKATPWEVLGPAQAESLLRFAIEPEIEHALEDAEVEERVESRIIRRKRGISDE